MWPWPGRRVGGCEVAGVPPGATPGAPSSPPDRDRRQDRRPVEPSLAAGVPRGKFGEIFRGLIRRLSGSRSPASRPAAPARRLAPAGLAAALAVFLLVLPAGPEAHAQTPEVLVSNVGQTLADEDQFSVVDFALSFTTGRNPRGYTLTGIELRLRSTSGTTLPP